MIRSDAFNPARFPVVALILIAAFTVTGCTQVPELDATIPDNLRNAPYPRLIALDKTFTTTRLPQDQASEIEDALMARSAGLQARARALNTRGIDPATRKRMADGIDQ